MTASIYWTGDVQLWDWVIQ